MLDDLRSGIRQIRRNPGFACAVVVTLALGIGAPTAVFTLVDPMLFRPLPYPEADRLVRVSASGGGLRMPDYVAAREQHGGFEQLVLPFASMPVRLTGAEGSVWAASVERGFFETLRIDPAVGRRFLESEYLASQTQNVPEAALITWGFWQRFFGGRPDVLDEAIELSGTAAAFASSASCRDTSSTPTIATTSPSSSSRTRWTPRRPRPHEAFWSCSHG